MKITIQNETNMSSLDVCLHTRFDDIFVSTSQSTVTISADIGNQNSMHMLLNRSEAIALLNELKVLEKPECLRDKHENSM